MSVLQTADSTGDESVFPVQTETSELDSDEPQQPTRLSRLVRSSIVRGLLLWSFLIGFAYLVGTLFIAPMISDAAGLQHRYVWTPSTGSKSSKSSSEPDVQITSVGAAKIVNLSAVQPQPLKEKPHKKKRSRHKVVKDEFYAGSNSGFSNGEGAGRDKPKEDKHGDEHGTEQKDAPPPPDTGDGPAGESGNDT
jgi:hypothetical protein